MSVVALLTPALLGAVWLVGIQGTPVLPQLQLSHLGTDRWVYACMCVRQMCMCMCA
jgi:hypothetical protein